MKSFISTFFICIVITVIAAFFFANSILTNIWYAMILIAFIMAVIITAFMNQADRIDQLEEKLNLLLNNNDNNETHDV